MADLQLKPNPSPSIPLYKQQLVLKIQIHILVLTNLRTITLPKRQSYGSNHTHPLEKGE